MELARLLRLFQEWWQELYQNSPTLFNPIIFSLLLIFFSFYVFKLIRSPKLNLPPSPTRLPIIGNLLQVGKDLHRSLRDLSEKHGPIMLVHFCNVPTLVVSSEELSREILNNCIFQNRPEIKAATTLFYGCSLGFCPYGDYWREIRKICVHELLSARSVQAFRYVREAEVAEIVENVRRCCTQDCTSIDLSEVFVNIAGNIVSRSTLGQTYAREDGGESLGVLARRAMELICAFSFQDYAPYLGWIDVFTGFNARVRETVKALHGLLDQVFEEHLQRNGNQSDKKDLLDILFHIQKNGQLEINLTSENLKAILLDMFIGGVDTSVSTMEWAMAELVKNPNLMKKVQEEVRRVVGNKSMIDEADIDQMGFLKCVVKETLRLHAPAMIIRESIVGTKLGGYDIPPKTRVLINAWAIQRDPKLWERPEEFVPERFANSPVDFKGHHSQFIPFGSGRRGCPGIMFAIVEIEYALANLLCWFDWKLPAGQTVEDLDMSDGLGLVIRKKVPLHLVPVIHTCSS